MKHLGSNTRSKFIPKTQVLAMLELKMLSGVLRLRFSSRGAASN